MDSSQVENQVFRVLFVCTGNTCRSPMAEAIARRQAAELGWDQVEFRSAGVGAAAGSPASDGALRVAEAHGLDLSRHGARLLDAREVDRTDLILAMSPTHLMRVVELGAGERAALLTSYAGGHPEDSREVSVPDPIGGPDEEYEETFRLLETLIERVLARLEPVLSK